MRPIDLPRPLPVLPSSPPRRRRRQWL